MNGMERRQEILNCIKNSSSPISGTRLAEAFHVSRQVIVQDIALLRAGNSDIISTNRGYIYHAPVTATRVFYVCHQDNDILEELNTIVDFGGTVLDVFVDHEIYGQLRAELSINTRKKAFDFCDEIEKGTSKPLKNITFGYHYHTVQADSESTLDLIQEALHKKGFLM